MSLTFDRGLRVLGCAISFILLSLTSQATKTGELNSVDERRWQRYRGSAVFFTDFTEASNISDTTAVKKHTIIAPTISSLNWHPLAVSSSNSTEMQFSKAFTVQQITYCDDDEFQVSAIPLLNKIFSPQCLKTDVFPCCIHYSRVQKVSCKVHCKWSTLTGRHKQLIKVIRDAVPAVQWRKSQDVYFGILGNANWVILGSIGRKFDYWLIHFYAIILSKLCTYIYLYYQSSII